MQMPVVVKIMGLLASNADWVAYTAFCSAEA